jgi:hypothetical protein
MRRFLTTAGALLILALAIAVNLLTQQFILPLQVFWGELVVSLKFQEVIFLQEVWEPSQRMELAVYTAKNLVSLFVAVADRLIDLVDFDDGDIQTFEDSVDSFLDAEAAADVGLRVFFLVTENLDGKCHSDLDQTVEHEDLLLELFFVILDLKLVYKQIYE